MGAACSAVFESKSMRMHIVAAATFAGTTIAYYILIPLLLYGAAPIVVFSLRVAALFYVRPGACFMAVRSRLCSADGTSRVLATSCG